MTTRVWWLIFVLGLVLSLVMVLRSQVEGDQLNMLARGWRFAFAGEWLQYGMPTSAGGYSPGGLLSLLVGLPLVVWADYRAPAVLVWLLSVVGYLILDRIVDRMFGPSWRLVFAVLYWLNPWRIYFTSMLWNPSYMFFFGSLHLGIAYLLRHRPRFWCSLILALIFGMAIQLHTSAILLLIMSVVLWRRGLVRLNWYGVMAGGLLTAASVVPWARLIVQRPEFFPGGNGFPFRSLLLVQPTVRGLMYLVRYPSLAVPRQVYELDFVPESVVDDTASSVLAYGLVALGWVTVLLPLWAYRRFFRRSRGMWRHREWTGTDRVWLRGYVLWSLVGCALAFAASPTTVMFWQGFPAFHVAVLTVVFAAGTSLHAGQGPVTSGTLAAWAVTSLLVVCVLALSSPMFQRSLPQAETPAMETRPDGQPRYVADHPMYHDLGIVDRCSVVPVDGGGWWPDVLAPASAVEDNAAEGISRLPPG